ncbi:hypothetical protein F2Q70_00000074 [Brassica cretica]|uniref:Coenzyme Q-binding protein COQ10 START domain-containing protein n=1 Tax=Brassica cretica TaxID=69181 RepID=A0A8S9IU15_BRACR|nr:hypothetical protein F2Q70_00000074 [Brassica cretica]
MNPSASMIDTVDCELEMTQHVEGSMSDCVKLPTKRKAETSLVAYSVEGEGSGQEEEEHEEEKKDSGESDQIVSDFSSAFPHPRAAALATTTTTTSTSSISISHSPAIKFHSTNASPFSTLLLASSSSSSTHGKTEDGVVLISVEKLEKSSRRIRSKVGIEASLDAVLTDYEKLSEFIPGLVVSELVEKEGNRVRLFQVSSSHYVTVLHISVDFIQLG